MGEVVAALITGCAMVAVALIGAGVFRFTRSARDHANRALVKAGVAEDEAAVAKATAIATATLIEEQARAIGRLEAREADCQRRVTVAEERVARCEAVLARAGLTS